MKIVTLTLNPAIDVHCHTADFQPYHENLCSVTSRDAGGKGVNISRALTANGIENLAVVILGEENGASFRSGLLADGLQLLELSVPGSIRENITLHCDNGPETRISFSGFSVSDDLISRLEAELLPQIDEDTVLTFTGSNPKGLSMERVKTFLRKVMQAGTKVVIDSRSFSLQDLLSLKPWLIKPNEEEISQYLQRTVSSFEEVLSSAKELHGQGIENVMISLGAQGALLVCSSGCFVARPPKIEALSTIGAGDSSIAGFVSVACASAEQRLSTAVSFGTAACLTPGTRPPLPADVARISRQIQLENL